MKKGENFDGFEPKVIVGFCDHPFEHPFSDMISALLPNGNVCMIPMSTYENLIDGLACWDGTLIECVLDQ